MNDEDICVTTEEGPMLDPRWEAENLVRKQDKCDLIEWILNYRNPADDSAKLRQIRIVME